MRKLTCTGCGATLQWDGQASVVECQFCGARFAMRGSEAGGERDAWRTDALRGGCVADRPCLCPCVTELDDTGAVYYKSWLPEGWKYQVYVPSMLYYGVSAGSPFVPGIRMESPDGSACIDHVTTNAYRDPAGQPVGPFAQMGVGGGMMGGLIGGLASGMGGLQYGNGELGIDGLVHYPNSVLDPRDFVRIRPFVGAADYCDEVALRTQVDGLQCVHQVTEDDWVRQRMQAMLAKAPEQVRQSYWYEWCRRVYRGTRNGEAVFVAVEAQVSTNGWNVGHGMPEPQQQEPAHGGIFGRMAAAMGNAAQRAAVSIAQAQIPHLWNTDYEMVMIAPEAQSEAVFAEFEQVRKSIELGQDFPRAQAAIQSFIMQNAQQVQGTFNNAVAQMAADRAASMDRRAAIISDTNAYTTNVMREMNANTAATHDRVAGMHSEMLREVNSYSGYGGRVVEADIGYDHVYQGTPGSRWGTDTYVASEGDWLEPGTDFVELPKRK